MTLICMKMKLHGELIFIWKVSHLDLFWNRGTRELTLNPNPKWPILLASVSGRTFHAFSFRYMFSSNFHFPRFPAVNRFPLNFSGRNGAFGHTCARLVARFPARATACTFLLPFHQGSDRRERPTTPEKFENAALFLPLGLLSTLIRHENAALFLPLGLPSTLIRHENGSFRKCFSNWRNLKTPSFPFSVDKKHFELYEAFQKR